MLLGKGGKLIFFGPLSGLEMYFVLIGFQCPPQEALPDFIMEVIGGKVTSKLDPDFTPDDLPLCTFDL